MSTEDEAPAMEPVEVSAAEDNDDAKTNPQLNASTLGGGKRKKGNRLIDDTATLLNLAMQASGVQQSEVDKKLEKSHQRQAKQSSSSAGDKAGQQPRKSKKFRDMKQQLRGQGPAKPAGKGHKSQEAKTSSTASRKKVAFQ